MHLFELLSSARAHLLPLPLSNPLEILPFACFGGQLKCRAALLYDGAFIFLASVMCFVTSTCASNVPCRSMQLRIGPPCATFPEPTGRSLRRACHYLFATDLSGSPSRTVNFPSPRPLRGKEGPAGNGVFGCPVGRAQALGVVLAFVEFDGLAILPMDSLDKF